MSPSPIAEPRLPESSPPPRRSGLRRPALGLLAAVAALAGCGPTFLERAIAEPGAVRLPAGGSLRTLRAGDGPIPHVDDRVRVTWVGRFADGKPVAAGAHEGPTLEIAPSVASPCWRDALTRMHVGEKARVVCGPDSAVGEEGPRVPPNTTVAFELELLAAGVAAQEPLPAGITLHTVHPGSGDRPAVSDRVKVHYEGRLADGTVFDSSPKGGEPVVLPLSGVIPCWRFAMQRMRVGEKAELTCAPDVAYGKKGSPPAIPPEATLTFDVELVGIEH